MHAALRTASLIVGLAGCTCAGETPVDRTPETLPTPHTADQIRDAMPAGHVVLLRHSGPAGSTLTRWTVSAADAHGVTLDVVDDVDGAAQARTDRHGWTVVRDHAAFPADRAQRVRERFTSPLAAEGAFDGWRYDVVQGDRRTTFWFADALPGPPVRMETLRGDTVVGAMTQIARTGTAVPPTPPED